MAVLNIDTLIIMGRHTTTKRLSLNNALNDSTLDRSRAHSIDLLLMEIGLVYFHLSWVTRTQIDKREYYNEDYEL